MRAVIQRVSKASVTVDGELTGQVAKGLLVLLGIEAADVTADLEWLAAKLVKLRIFPDADQNMNLSVQDVDGGILVVSQFTLHANTRKGTRPSFIKAARPEQAEPMYEQFCEVVATELGKPVQKGIFGAMMEVELVNDGPVTIIIDTKNRE